MLTIWHGIWTTVSCVKVKCYSEKTVITLTTARGSFLGKCKGQVFHEFEQRTNTAIFLLRTNSSTSMTTGSAVCSWNYHLIIIRETKWQRSIFDIRGITSRHDFLKKGKSVGLFIHKQIKHCVSLTACTTEEWQHEDNKPHKPHQSSASKSRPRPL